MIFDSKYDLIDDKIEVAVLRSMIDEPAAAAIATHRITGLSFGAPRRGQLFVLLRTMFQEAGKIDELQVHGRIARFKHGIDRDAVTAVFQETESLEAVGVAVSIEAHCERLTDLAARRDAKRKAQELDAKASDFTTDIAKEFSESALKIEKHSARNIVVGTFDALSRELNEAKDGQRFAVPFPWSRLSAATHALLPGTLTAICGTPGASKSLMVNQCLLEWHTRWKCASLVLEDGVTYHMRRALAQLSDESDVTSDDWCKQFPGHLDQFAREHQETLSAFGKCLYEVERDERPTVDYTVEWIAARAREGNRIICVDPMTMIEHQGKPWLIEDFVCRAKGIAERYKCSVLVVTHPRKQTGDNRGSITLDDLAGSAAVQRFGQCIIWLQAHAQEELAIESKDAARAEGMEAHFDAKNKGAMNFQACNRTAVILKARNSWGGGEKIGFWFDSSSLRLTERGVILGKSRETA